MLSFFMPGIGQLIKGDLHKAFIIWAAYLAAFLSFFMFAQIPPLAIFGIFSILAFPVIWVWQLYDAYNA